MEESGRKHDVLPFANKPPLQGQPRVTTVHSVAIQSHNGTLNKSDRLPLFRLRSIAAASHLDIWPPARTLRRSQRPTLGPAIPFGGPSNKQTSVGETGFTQRPRVANFILSLTDSPRVTTIHLATVQRH